MAHSRCVNKVEKAKSDNFGKKYTAETLADRVFTCTLKRLNEGALAEVLLRVALQSCGTCMLPSQLGCAAGPSRYLSHSLVRA